MSSELDMDFNFERVEWPPLKIYHPHRSARLYHENR